MRSFSLPAAASRRLVIKAGVATSVGLLAERAPLAGAAASHSLALVRKPIPSTRQMLPAVGLGTNNFVTILERTDVPVNQVPAALSFPPPTPTVMAKKSAAPARLSDEGEIETFTVVYVTPDGFLPPLALALILPACR